MPKGVYQHKLHTEETKRKMSETRTGKPSHPQSEEARKKISEANKGKIPYIMTETIRKKKSELNKGDKCNFWKGGITSINLIIRMGIDFRLWREAVFARDNWTCQRCKKRGKRLCSHHIQNFSQFPELRFAIDNGITFCRECHVLFHKIYGRQNNNKEQLKNYLIKKAKIPIKNL